MMQYGGPATPNWAYNRDKAYETAHLPNAQHRDSLASFHFPTLGMPVIETHFNDAKVGDNDLGKFD